MTDTELRHRKSVQIQKSGSVEQIDASNKKNIGKIAQKFLKNVKFCLVFIFSSIFIYFFFFINSHLNTTQNQIVKN